MEHRVARVAELANGAPLAIRVAGRRLLVVRHEGRFTVLDERCPHRGATLAAGEFDGPLVRCVAHLWCWDLRTGKCVDDASGDPPSSAPELHRYPSRVEAGWLWVTLPR